MILPKFILNPIRIFVYSFFLSLLFLFLSLRKLHTFVTIFQLLDYYDIIRAFQPRLLSARSKFISHYFMNERKNRVKNFQHVIYMFVLSVI